MLFASKKNNVVLWTAIVFGVLGLAANAKASTPNLSQPLMINWAAKPTAFFEYGQRLSYRFTITSTSDQVNYVHMFVESYAQPAKVFQAGTLTRVYKLLPGQSIDILYQAYAPTDAGFGNSEFRMDASIAAEGYPSLTIGADAWHDSGK